MKLVLYIDLITKAGHRKFNQLVINALRKEFKILTVASREATDSIPDLEIPDRFLNFSSRFNYRIKILQEIDWIIEKIISFGKFDLVLFSSYETISFAIKSHRIVGLFENVAVFDHNNIDEIERSRIKKLFFKSIDTNVTHLVFEEYFKTHLIENVKIKNNVVVVPHLVEDKKTFLDPVRDWITVFVPSNKCDDQYIKKLILGSSPDIRFVIKSDKHFAGQNVRTVPSFENDEYENVFADCNFVILPLTVDYNYRISNIIFECFSYSKPCFTFRNKMSEFLSNLYPSIVHIIDRGTLLDEIVDEYKKIDKDSFFIERKQFLHSHSESAFLNGIRKLPI